MLWWNYRRAVSVGSTIISISVPVYVGGVSIFYSCTARGWGILFVLRYAALRILWWDSVWSVARQRTISKNVKWPCMWRITLWFFVLTGISNRDMYWLPKSKHCCWRFWIHCCERLIEVKSSLSPRSLQFMRFSCRVACTSGSLSGVSLVLRPRIQIQRNGQLRRRMNPETPGSCSPAFPRNRVILVSWEDLGMNLMRELATPMHCVVGIVVCGVHWNAASNCLARPFGMPTSTAWSVSKAIDLYSKKAVCLEHKKRPGMEEYQRSWTSLRYDTLLSYHFLKHSTRMGATEVVISLK